MFEEIKWKENGKLKLLIIVGTRPEVIRLSEVIKKCRKYFDTLLAHTGQNYDYNLNGILLFQSRKYTWTLWGMILVRPWEISLEKATN